MHFEGIINLRFTYICRVLEIERSKWSHCNDASILDTMNHFSDHFLTLWWNFVPVKCTKFLKQQFVCRLNFFSISTNNHSEFVARERKRKARQPPVLQKKSMKNNICYVCIQKIIDLPQ